MVSRVIEWPKLPSLPGFEDFKGNKDVYIERLLRDRVFLITHLISSLTSEEAPSCFELSKFELIMILFIILVSFD